MIEKNKVENESKKERFEFVLTINDNTICQRYFRINGFNEQSIYSKDLLETFRNCVNLIKHDLIEKTKVYLYCTAPQVCENEDEVKKYISKYKEPANHILDYILCKETDSVYAWDGKNLAPYDGYFNKFDYVEKMGEKIEKYGVSDVVYDTPYTLKFSFLDNGRPILTEVWDGNIYPKFIRTNIDLSNSKNRYWLPDNFSPFDAMTIDAINEGRVDNIPIIIRELCIACSYGDSNKYNFTEEYAQEGKDIVTYNFNLVHSNIRLARKWTAAYQKNKKQ